MGTVFGGAILSEIDLAAAIEAQKLHDGHVVTIAMDKVEFRHPVHVGDIISVYTERARHGSTSVTVHVEVWAESRRPPHTPIHVTAAQVTMVAVDENGDKMPLSEA